MYHFLPLDLAQGQYYLIGWVEDVSMFVYFSQWEMHYLILLGEFTISWYNLIRFQTIQELRSNHPRSIQDPDGHVVHVIFSGQMAYDGMVMEKQWETKGVGTDDAHGTESKIEVQNLVAEHLIDLPREHTNTVTYIYNIMYMYIYIYVYVYIYMEIANFQNPI